MQQTPEATAKLVSDQYHRDGHGHYILLRGTAPGKGFWLEKFGNTMVDDDPELMTSVYVDRKTTPMVYGGDLINELTARRAKVVIVMGPNLGERDERQHRAIASYFGFKFHTVDNFLTDEEKLNFPAIEPPLPYDPNLQDVVIVDLDGTYADSSHRHPFNATPEEIMRDTVIPHVADVVMKMHAAGAQIFFVTGRGYSEEEMIATLTWLRHNSVVGDDFDLISRLAGDNRSDSVVKAEIYNKYIRGKYNVKLVLDDRPKVVRTWHELGLPVLANQAYIRGEF